MKIDKFIWLLYGIAIGMLVILPATFCKNCIINQQEQLIDTYREFVNTVDSDSLYDGRWELYCEVQYLDSIYNAGNRD